MATPEQVIAKEIDKKMDDFTDRVFQLSQENLTIRHPKLFKDGSMKDVITTDKGTLLKTGRTEKRFLNKSIIYNAPYSSTVEFGSDGTPTNPKELETWVRRKLFKNKPAKDSTVERVARNIAKSLGERGQAQDPFLRPAISTAIKEFNL